VPVRAPTTPLDSPVALGWQQLIHIDALLDHYVKRDLRSNMTSTVVSSEAIANAAAIIRSGNLVAFPTETVYGLGADATNAEAVAKIFTVKGRPHFNPLIAHVVDLVAAEKLAVFDERARNLAVVFWPGPLTMVLPRRPTSELSALMTAGLDTVAVRVPSHPIAQALLRAAGVPVAAPSANRSGRVSPTTAAHVASDLGADIGCILDGGACDHGVESTVVAFAEAVVILRPGSITAEQIAAVIGHRVSGQALREGDAPSAPGQLASHYAPTAKVRLAAVSIRQGEALLAFGPNPVPTSGPQFNLSLAGSLDEAAANLFAGLRALDRDGVTCIAVMPVPHHGVGAAINDRLQRAAAGR
jgi:L-threonylcarbamoyladenylate synthase